MSADDLPAATKAAGRALIEQRLRWSGVTKTELARTLGMSASVLSRKLGERYPDTLSEPEIRRLADYLSLSSAQRESLRRCYGADWVPVHAAARVRQPSSNLPLPLTSFVGRDAQLAGIRQRFAGCRLLTLTGAGGCGKTRLALEYARSLTAHEPDGVWLVELAALTDPALVPHAVAAILGIREEPGRALLTTLAAALAPRQLVLLLDNCEHLVEGCASMATVLLQACPTVRILATSRQPLGLTGECRWQVPPLAVPDPDQLPPFDALIQTEAVRLFVERARCVLPSFTLVPGQAPAVARICQQLDGIPLALELAAARVGVLSVDQIAARLDDRFRLLTGGSPTAVPRQRTLRDAMAWSYDLLTPAEQALFRRLSVFVGGCTLAAAEAVCGGDGDVLDLMASLVEKSLLRTEDTADGEPRFTMLKTIREFAVAELSRTGELEALCERHATYAMTIAEAAEALERRRSSPRRVAWRQRQQQLQMEHHNITAALTWATEHGAVEVAMRLFRASLPLFTADLVSEGARWAQRVVGLPADGVPDGVRGGALHAAVVIAWLQGDLVRMRAWSEQSVPLLRVRDDHHWLGHALALYALARVDQDRRVAALAHEAVALARATGDRWAVAEALNFGAMVAIRGGDGATARTWWEEYAAINEELGDPVGRAAALNNLAGYFLHEGDAAAARQSLEAGLAIYRTEGIPRLVALALCWLGWIARRQGDAARAARSFAESIRVAGDTGSLTCLADCCAGIAGLGVDAGDGHRAARLLGAAARLRLERQAPRPPWLALQVESIRANVQAALGAEGLAARYAAGRALAPAQAIAEALACAEAWEGYVDGAGGETEPGERNAGGAG